ncbi:MAG: hypothetical protein AAFR23_08580 [Pseudomonadota bacterium]
MRAQFSSKLGLCPFEGVSSLDFGLPAFRVALLFVAVPQKSITAAHQLLTPELRFSFFDWSFGARFPYELDTLRRLGSRSAILAIAFAALRH